MRSLTRQNATVSTENTDLHGIGKTIRPYLRGGREIRLSLSGEIVNEALIKPSPSFTAKTRLRVNQKYFAHS